MYASELNYQRGYRHAVTLGQVPAGLSEWKLRCNQWY